MNIFFLDSNPVKAAEYMVDKHVVKMILESAQLLSTAHRVLDGTKKEKLYIIDDDRNEHIYKATHVNHPCSIWLRESIENYNWLVDHYYALMQEYSYRYGKKHKCNEIARFIETPPFNLKNWSRTPVKLAMPDEYKVDDPVESYRNYYRGAKQDLFKWTKRERPEWL